MLTTLRRSSSPRMSRTSTLRGQRKTRISAATEHVVIHCGSTYKTSFQSLVHGKADKAIAGALTSPRNCFDLQIICEDARMRQVEVRKSSVLPFLSTLEAIWVFGLRQPSDRAGFSLPTINYPLVCDKTSLTARQALIQRAHGTHVPVEFVMD
jgi:hypothetical protein